MKEEKIMAKKNETPSTEQVAVSDQVSAIATDQPAAISADPSVADTAALDGPKDELPVSDDVAVILPAGMASSGLESAEPPKSFVLLKNHGLHTDGRTCEFFEAGREFDAVKDSALISRLVRSGAELEQR
jgi:hypothetical protein